jgi:hypothetical protein
MKLLEKGAPAADGARLLLLVSPTRATCLRGVSAIQPLLSRIKPNEVTVLVVWEPMLPSDWSRPTQLALSRIPDSRAIQLWDKDHLVAKELDQQLACGQFDCCKRDGIIWDVVALYPAKVEWGARPVFINGPGVKAEPELSKEMQILLR